MVADVVDGSYGTVDHIEDSGGDRDNNETSATHYTELEIFKAAHPGGIPARWQSSAMIMAAPGSRSDGLRTRVFPVHVARGIVHKGIMLHLGMKKAVGFHKGVRDRGTGSPRRVYTYAGKLKGATLRNSHQLESFFQSDVSHKRPSP